MTTGDDGIPLGKALGLISAAVGTGLVALRMTWRGLWPAAKKIFNVMKLEGRQNRLEAKVDGGFREVNAKADTILTNHLPHIDRNLVRLEWYMKGLATGLGIEVEEPPDDQ